ncbi:monovalent cation/H+ antiporter complex subunit F [Candidatus Parabeggiatoa sp. HSG14]|uniref:monovalent cation/H+ antiporter complex subunit F n=1 Tax=Candidatus Parabeggiatoa sp. HSG14 TaxID=3055593 RepID=UPI0025A73F40|nr:monovalent cation/H+ antiporter complex subunit F [Thiotrichales bacterium HSG14]
MNLLNLGLEILALIFISTGLGLGLWRLFKGPTVPDRVVAADTLAIVTTAGLVWIASKFDNPIYLDIALVYGALAFVAIITIARTIETAYSSK